MSKKPPLNQVLRLPLDEKRLTLQMAPGELEALQKELCVENGVSLDDPEVLDSLERMIADAN